LTNNCLAQTGQDVNSSTCRASATGQPEPLPIFLVCHEPIFDVERRVLDDKVEVIEVLSHRIHSLGARQRV
jgi:hypothetical protein